MTTLANESGLSTALWLRQLSGLGKYFADPRGHLIPPVARQTPGAAPPASQPPRPAFCEPPK